VGGSEPMQRLRQTLARIAPTRSTVLIQGETGTGKDLLARAIHHASDRADAPFVRANCAAMPSSLIDSTLFGHEAGSFTGAHRRQLGRFERAHGGTLFIDEIGELPLTLQPKLLHALQEREIERVGGAAPVAVDVRVVAATNRHLAEMVATGAFRADLYYRLNVLTLNPPPLRERLDDLPFLVDYFLNKHARLLGQPPRQLCRRSLARLEGHPWPGNVRELEHAIERGVVMSEGAVVTVDEISLPTPPRECAPIAMRDVERAHITQILERCEGRVEGPNGAATLLGLRPSTLRSRMLKLGIAR
jgi:transcriptional regulator with PAS, ATPase and Fis domain